MANTAEGNATARSKCFKCYETEVRTQEDLHDLIKELRQQFATLRYNDTTMIVEIWSGRPDDGWVKVS